MTTIQEKIEMAKQRLQIARVRLEEAEQLLNIACGEGTRKQIDAADEAFRIALDQCIEIEDKIEAMTEDQIDEGIDAEADRCSSHIDCSEGGAA